MNRAIALSRQSLEPIGCGVVMTDRSGKVIAEAYNSQRADRIAVNHAEIKAIIEANESLGVRKLKDTTVYCSCEPCAMCLTALSYANVGRIVFYNTMKDLFPSDPQSQLDSFQYIKGLNFVPKLEQLRER